MALKQILAIALLMSLAGCGAPDWQRIGFETLESWRQRQCAQYTDSGPEWAECVKRHDYATWQRERAEAGR